MYVTRTETASTRDTPERRGLFATWDKGDRMSHEAKGSRFPILY